MLFSCVINNCTVELPLFFNPSPQCQSFVQKPVYKTNPAQLMKMDRCIAFSNIHGEKALADITAKLIKDCCSESPNAFWTREKYFVSLPFDPLQKIKPMKASARLMSPSERYFCASEIKELLSKGLIEPSKIPWACREFVVNKHSEIKRGKPGLLWIISLSMLYFRKFGTLC